MDASLGDEQPMSGQQRPGVGGDTRIGEECGGRGEGCRTDVDKCGVKDG